MSLCKCECDFKPRRSFFHANVFTEYRTAIAEGNHKNVLAFAQEILLRYFERSLLFFGDLTVRAHTKKCCDCLNLVSLATQEQINRPNESKIESNSNERTSERKKNKNCASCNTKFSTNCSAMDFPFNLNESKSL